MTPIDLTELDRLLAEKVMGWLRPAAKWFDAITLHRILDPCTEEYIDWHPTTDIAQAMIVAERMNDSGWNLTLCSGNGWGATFYKVNFQETSETHIVWEESHGPVNADTPALAICLAARKWLESK